MKLRARGSGAMLSLDVAGDIGKITRATVRLTPASKSLIYTIIVSVRRVLY